MNEEITMEEFMNMLSNSIHADMQLSMKNDTLTITGGVGITLLDMYILMKALEVVGARMLPTMKDEESLKTALKNAIDTMDFKEVSEND